MKTHEQTFEWINTMKTHEQTFEWIDTMKTHEQTFEWIDTMKTNEQTWNESIPWKLMNRPEMNQYHENTFYCSYEAS